MHLIKNTYYFGNQISISICSMKRIEIFQSYEELKSDREKQHPVSKSDLAARKKATQQLKTYFNKPSQ
jgi:hypothetical protein